MQPTLHLRQMLKRGGAVIASMLVAVFPLAAAGADETRRLTLNAVAIGALSRSDLGIGMLDARAVISPHLVVSVAPTIVSAGGARTEGQLRTSATLLLDVGPVAFDDRNLWVFSDAGTTRYRNRLRLTAPAVVHGRSLRLQLLDELFYEEGGRGWFRNMAGMGVGVDIARSVSVDAYWTLVKEDHRTQTSLFYVVLTAPIF